MLLTGFVPLFVIAYVGYSLAKTALQTEAYVHMQGIAEMKAKQIESWFDERLTDIEALANSQCVIHICPIKGQKENVEQEETCQLLNSYKQQSISYDDIYIFDLDFKPIISTCASLISEPHQNEIRQIIDMITHQSDPYISRLYRRSDNSASIYLGRKILNAENKTVGYVVASFSLIKTLDPIMKNVIGLGNTGETYLVDQNGIKITLARLPNSDSVHAMQMDSFSFRERLLGKSGATTFMGYKGQEVLGYYLWMPRYQWALIAKISTTEILRPIYFIRTAVLISGLALLAAVMLFSIYFSRGITKPILSVANAAHSVGAGDLTVRVRVESEDEVGKLAESFNNMVENMSNSRTELQRKSMELESAYNDLLAAQKGLVQHERMAAIGQFIASIVHEMRNPLWAISMNLQILSRSLGDNALLQEHMEIARGSVSRLQKMFTDLLDFAKPITIRPEPIHIRALIESVVGGFNSAIEQAVIQTQIDIRPVDLDISADPERFRQVLVNLINNAVDAMPEGGVLTVKARMEDNVLHLTVEDTGTGIPAENRKRLFEPFFTTKEKGVGLGLLVVKKIVEAHDGVLDIKSEPGKGTAVEIQIKGVTPS